ncbi:MAG: 2-oxoacid:acceptor oxidoreductase subunit alpha [Thermoleophilia bacterium]
MDLTIRIGGEAGQGLQTIGAVLGKLFARMGYHVFTHQDYMSRVRGGHNFYQVRFSDAPVSSSRRGLDLLIALDRTTVDTHQGDLNPFGLIVYDSAATREHFDEPQFIDIPFRQLATDTGGSRLMENTVALGTVMGLLDLDTAPLEELLRQTFQRKGDEIVDLNIAAARAGARHTLDNCEQCQFSLTPAGGEPLMLLDGTSAVGLGALLGGCRFYAAYPMTPSTGVLNFMAAAGKKHNLVVEQAEDEIAAINMAVGASFAGVRSMTGTAGGGFALMEEGLSLAGMTETPVVIFVGMRPAPATGLPTRTEQGDLLMLVHAAHGEFPRIIMAPGTPEEAFYLTGKAFDLAEKYQVPAFILMDQYLGDSEWTFPGLDATRIPHHDYRLRAGDLEALDVYQRHAYTDSGVSPLAEPGASRHLVVTDSDEHDEDGHLVEDAATRVKMVGKRLLKKLPLITAQMSPPSLFGAADAETVVVCWGSNQGIVNEAVAGLEPTQSIAALHFSELWPLPGTQDFDWLAQLTGARRTICLENNASGQLARLIRMETGYAFDEHINRYDGRPFLLEEMMERLA